MTGAGPRLAPSALAAGAVALGLLVLLVQLALPASGKEQPAEAQESYPPGSATADVALAANESKTVDVTPKLAVSFVAAEGGARLNVTVAVKWKAAGLPEPLPEVPGAQALSYIHVAGQEDGIAQVRFDCLVDPGYRHDLLYWDGVEWASLSARSGQRILAQGDAGDLRVLEAGEADGHFVAVVDHASAFALTSAPPPMPEGEDGRGAPATGALASLAALGLAVMVATGNRRNR